MTEEERAELRRMEIPAIRRAQHLVALQIPIAHESRNHAALAKLREWEQDYIDELLRRTEAGDAWTPEYERWRHGGWYVSNVRYSSGAVGCVSRNFKDRKWRIVCDKRDGDHTYPSRDAAARAEREIATTTPKVIS